MSQNSHRPKACHAFQDNMARKREKDFQRAQNWGNQVRYYEKWGVANDRFDSWTSPRYYESNNQLIETERRDRQKRESVEKRREKLKKLLQEEDATYQIELMVQKAKGVRRAPAKLDDIPTELLEAVHVGVKEEDRTRHEAEQRLYYQWRNNSSSMRKNEVSKRPKDLKLSWLDHQIEKRMAKEKDEKEARIRRRERERRIAEQKEKEKLLEEETRLKNEKLKETMTSLMEEMRSKHNLTDELRRQEKIQLEAKEKLTELDEEMKAAEAKRHAQESSLAKLTYYKLKLKQKVKDVLENIRDGCQLLTKISDLNIVQHMASQPERDDLTQTIVQYLEFSREQEALEKKRLEFLDSAFDSELKPMYQRQSELWRGEELARSDLINDVLRTLTGHIEANLKSNKQKRIAIVLEREELLGALENCEKELQ